MFTTINVIRLNKNFEKMSEEIEKFKKPQKKPVRYFSDVNKVDEENVERIEVSNKKKANPFKGEVIQVQEKARFYGKSIWKNKRPDNFKPKRNRKAIKVEVDPYAKDRHSRK